MKHSEQLNEIAMALSKVQGEIRDADKDTSGYGYKYADLSQVLTIIRPLISKYGLSFTQHVSNADDKIVIETMILHSSGQWMSSEMAMPPVQGKSMNAAQAVGSIITYGRRYALTAIFGITQTDDDGAVDNKGAQNNHVKPAQQEKPAYAPPVVAGVESVFINKDQVFEISKLMFEAKADSAAFNASYNVKSFNQLTVDQYKDAVIKLKQKIEKAKKDKAQKDLESAAGQVFDKTDYMRV